MVVVRRAIVGGLGLAACQPILDSPESSDGSTTDASLASSGVAQTGPATAETGALEGSAVDEGDAASDDAGASFDDGTTPADLPDEDRPGLCDLDPYALDPWDTTAYRTCIRGLADLSVVGEQSGHVGYDAYAQFFTVIAEEDIAWEREILDPYDGTLDDCRLARYGNSGFGSPEQVVWEDAGDVTFVLGGTEVLADESGDPVSVLGYDANPGELGIAPAYLTPHGFVATGDTTEPMDFAEAVVLPERIELLAPSLDGSAVVDTADFVVQWVPGSLGVPFEISVNVAVSGDWDFQLFCRVVDDGEFVVPAELAQQLPRPADARLWLRRADVRVVMSADRGVLVTAAARTEGPLALE